MSSVSDNNDLQAYLDSLKEENGMDDALNQIDTISVVDEHEDNVDDDHDFIDDGNEEPDDDASSDNENNYTSKTTVRDYYIKHETKKVGKSQKATEPKEAPPRRVTRASKPITAPIKVTEVVSGRATRTTRSSKDPKASKDERVYEFIESESTANEPSVKRAKLDNSAAAKKIASDDAKIIQIDASSDGVDGVHKCTHCSYTTNKRYILSRHMKAHSDEYNFKCSVCERSFKTNVSLVNHMNAHLGRKPYACRFCYMCFTTSGEAIRHARYRHTKDKPHKCPECDYCSVELSKVRRHMRCHTGERPYQCPHCTYASPDTFKLKRHLRTHTGEKPYECDICQARFTQSNSLKHHRLIHSVGEKPVFQCHLCPTTCGRKNDLRLHIQKLHHSDKPIPCKICGKELPDRYSYKQHYKTHDGEKCYRCELCPYASTSQLHLQSHMLIHSGKKPFKCDQCDQSFRQRQLLRRHVNLYHTKDYVPPTPRDKVHQCQDCNRSFTHMGNLMRHMKTHDPESNVQREKLELKLGRMTRIQPDGTVVSTINVVEGDEFESADAGGVEVLPSSDVDATTEMAYEIIEYEEGEDEDFVEIRKPPIVKRKVVVNPKKTQLMAKIPGTVMESTSGDAEKDKDDTDDGKEFMALAVDDGQDYMVVEVIRCEDDDDAEEGDEEVADIIVKNVTKSNNSTIKEEDTDTIVECVRFEGEEFIDDAELLNIVEGD